MSNKEVHEPHIKTHSKDNNMGKKLQSYGVYSLLAHISIMKSSYIRTRERTIDNNNFFTSIHFEYYVVIFYSYMDLSIKYNHFFTSIHFKYHVVVISSYTDSSMTPLVPHPIFLLLDQPQAIL